MKSDAGWDNISPEDREKYNPGVWSLSWILEEGRS
jgi:hypothetical protein